MDIQLRQSEALFFDGVSFGQEVPVPPTYTISGALENAFGGKAGSGAPLRSSPLSRFPNQAFLL